MIQECLTALEQIPSFEETIVGYNNLKFDVPFITARLKKSSEESFDLTAEKEGIKYCIEVKGTGQVGVMGRYIVPWHELKNLYLHYLLKDTEKALLMFVDDYGNYCMFQMIDGLMV